MKSHKWILQSDRNYFWHCMGCGCTFYSMMEPSEEWVVTKMFKGTELAQYHQVKPGKNHENPVIPEFHDCDVMAVHNVQTT